MAFSEAFIEVLCRLHSDHNPLFLRLGGLPQRKGPRPFHFEAAWIVHNDYQKVVEHAWKEKGGRSIDALEKVKEDSLNSTTRYSEIFSKGRRTLKLGLKVYKE